MSELKRKSLKGGIWVLGSKWGDYLIRIVVTGVLARILLPEDFGLVQLASLVVYFAEMFAIAGLGSAIIQKEEVSAGALRSAFAFVLLVSFVFTASILFFREPIATWFEEPKLAEVLVYYAFLPIVNAVSVISQAQLTKRLLFSKIAKVELLTFGLTYVPVAIGLAIQGFGVWSLVYANVLYYLVRSCSYFFSTEERYLPSFRYLELKPLLRFGLQDMFARNVNFFVLKGDNFLVGKFLGAESLGFYGKAYNIQSLFTGSFSLMIEKILFSAFSIKKDADALLATTAQRLLSVVNAFLFPGIVVFIFLADLIVLLLLGPGWEPSVLPLKILAVSAVFRINYKVIAEQIRARGDVRYISVVQILSFVWMLISLGVGLQFGLFGVAVAVTSLFIFQYVAFSAFLKKSNKFWSGPSSVVHFSDGVRLLMIPALAIVEVFLLKYLLAWSPGVIAEGLLFLFLTIANLLLTIIFFKSYLLTENVTWGLSLVKQSFSKKGSHDKS